MWTAVLLGAIVASVEPARLGLTVLMLNRPRPLLQLFVFLCGALAVGLIVGSTFLFALRIAPIVELNLSGPHIEIAFGLLLLAVAVLMIVISSTRGSPVPSSGRFQKISIGMGRILKNNSLWVAGVSGMGVAVPQANSLAMIAIIHASGADGMLQIMALLLFNGVAFSMVALPLVSYVVMPRKTYTALSSLHTWVRTRRPNQVAIIIAALGLIVLTLGAIGLIAKAG